MADGLLIKAFLSSPLAGEPPMLDSLLVDALCNVQGFYRRLSRSDRLPTDWLQGMRLPIPVRSINGRVVPLASSPIYRENDGTDRHDFIHKKLAVEHADLLAPDRRLKIAVGGGTYRSARLPIRARNVPVVAWFAIGHRREVLKALRKITSIGHKRDIGYGVVREWTAEPIDQDHTWFAPGSDGPILMRSLPVGPDLNGAERYSGARLDFVAVHPPYWHPDAMVEALVPC